LRIDIDANYLGAYYLDAGNLYEYPGHTLVNVAAHWQATGALRLSARARNVADRVIADRADFAFGNFRYFPGRGREVFVEFEYVPGR
jgi:outer membrane receptor protein involved in Fe transport